MLHVSTATTCPCATRLLLSHRLFEKLDGYALLVVLGNNLGLLIYASSGGSSGRAGDVRWGVLLTLMLAAAQYLLRLLRADVCRKHRHSLAVGNR